MIGIAYLISTVNILLITYEKNQLLEIIAACNVDLWQASHNYANEHVRIQRSDKLSCKC